MTRSILLIFIILGKTEFAEPNRRMKDYLRQQIFISWFVEDVDRCEKIN